MTDQTARIAELLREATTVLDEPFHRDSVAVTLLEAADLLTAQAERLAQVEPLLGDMEEVAAVRIRLAQVEAERDEWKRLANQSSEKHVSVSHKLGLAQDRVEAAETLLTKVQERLAYLVRTANNGWIDARQVAALVAAPGTTKVEDQER